MATRSAWHAVQERRGPPWFFLISALNQRSIGKSTAVPAGRWIDEAGLAKTVRTSTEEDVNDNVAISRDRKPWKKCANPVGTVAEDDGDGEPYIGQRAR